jgi:hypothetical protein
MERCGNRRWLILWLITFPIWINLHAGFVVGIGFVLLYAVEQALAHKPYARLIPIFCAMVLEILINPYGPKYFAYLAKALTMTRPRIGEWRPLWTLDWPFTLIFGLAVLIWVYSLVQTKTWRLPGILLLLASGIEGVLHRKLLPFFAITWLAYVPACFEATAAGEWLKEFSRRRLKFLVFAWSCVIVLCLAMAVRDRFWLAQVPQVSGPASYPVEAIEYLSEQHFHGNVMTQFGNGAYVSWKLFPAVKVAIDSRYEVAYPEDWVERIYRFYEASPGWQDTLTDYPTDAVIVPIATQVRSLIPSVAWKLVYADNQFEIYARPKVDLPFVRRSDTTMAGKFP